MTSTTTQHRLHRIEGQVRGIGRMIDDGRALEDVMAQAAAVHAALDAVLVCLVEDRAAAADDGAIHAADVVRLLRAA